jgi:methylenetetrahydrofolate reductase (NADPH)
MHVIEHLQNSKNPTVSIEIIPPKRGGSLASIDKAIQSIVKYKPPFIDVTSHAAEIVWEELPDGTYRRKVKRKSPGTFGLCAAIKYKYEIEPVPHILCGGFTREETEDALIELNYLGIENILAIRGDKRKHRPLPSDRSENKYAIDLVQQVDNMNKGQYLDTEMINAAHTNFCVGVAYYPEKHFESPNNEYGLKILKMKEDAGAHYGVSQMFFDTSKYLEFSKKAKEYGIKMPLVPGMKILTRKSQLTRIPSIFHIDIPNEFVERMMAAKSREEEMQVGVDWAYKQSLELLDAGIPYLHFYIMQKTTSFGMLMEKLKKKL